MYYREYFFYLKERLPEKCYEVLKECYKTQKNDIEENFKKLHNSNKQIEFTDILLPIKEQFYHMEYEILLREELITKDSSRENRYKLDRFGIYLLHYLNNWLGSKYKININMEEIMKDAMSFADTLYLLMEDFEYTIMELEDDIFSLLRDEFQLTLNEENKNCYFILESPNLSQNIKLSVERAEYDGEEFFLVSSVKVA